MIEHVLKASLERGNIITIIYSGKSGMSERNIKVLEIQEDKIKAYCYLRKQVRYFKLGSILSAAYFNSRKKVV
ncbi:hypothetical protein [Lutispora saccharofermentans]|uniref:WYL domain-containing protein n=1 Tax=Lutispora saccharofermentans TaxID=3024236 RepID=A0ABT1NJR1_9FIRM|nr:hypothetical protein [Lutispora saccharofermentans]MCQ1531431.1 hypothetical protein [Lutispora saccharofermentans]